GGCSRRCWSRRVVRGMPGRGRRQVLKSPVAARGQRGAAGGAGAPVGGGGGGGGGGAGGPGGARPDAPGGPPPTRRPPAPQAAAEKPAAAAPSGNPPCDVADLLKAHCARCHGKTLREGAPVKLVDAADFQRDLGGLTVGQAALRRVRDAARPMPPPPAARLTA